MRPDGETSDDPRRLAADPAPEALRLLVESAPIGMIHTDLDGTTVWVNDRWRAITGVHDPVPLGFERLDELVVPGDRDRVRRIYRDAALEHREFSAETTIRRPDDGRHRIVRMVGAPILDGADRLGGYIGTVRDVTEQREDDARRQAIVDALHDGLIVHDGETIFWLNAPTSEIFGRSREELCQPRGLRRIELLDEDGHPIDAGDRLGRAVLDTDEAHRNVIIGIPIPPEGTRWCLTSSVPLRHADSGAPYAVVTSLTDITDRRLAEEERERLAHIVEATSDLVGTADPRTRALTYLNRAARELFGLVDRPLAQHRFDDLFTEEAAALFDAVVEPALVEHGSWHGELPMRRADGETRLVWQTLNVERDHGGEIVQISAVGRDVTERRRIEVELAHRASHDSLTGLPNRATLLQRLEDALERTARTGERCALLFLDLDRFKQVNDTLGHDAGDELLMEVARRITSVLRPGDVVARLGGDEFVVLCESVTDERHAHAIAERVARAVDEHPVRVGDQEIPVTASIGIATSQGTVHPEAMLRDADAAMYRAKDLGRARLEVFDETLRIEHARRVALADELAAALERDEIVVHYQPCFDLASGRVLAVEALARWRHPERGLLGPAEFIALAEDTGMIVGLGLAVLTAACREARRWEEILPELPPVVHVNLSARQLATPNLPALVAGVLDSEALPAGRLCLEITESVLMEDAPRSVETLRDLKSLGLKLAIDDFGTGYSSLSYLHRFDVDLLKVDRSFVDGLGPDPEDSAIVAAIIGLARSLELEAVAEGVEHAGQVPLLRDLGCHAAQGFLFSHPVPAEELRALLGR